VRGGVRHILRLAECGLCCPVCEDRFIVRITTGRQACFLRSDERCRFVRNTFIVECAIDSVRRFLVCAVVCIAGFRSILCCFCSSDCVGSALLCVERAFATVRVHTTRRMYAV
jgi:hypothetical protein